MFFRPIHALLHGPARVVESAAASKSHKLVPQTLIKSYHSSRRLQLPYKDDQDRGSLKPQSTQGTQSGTDDTAAKTDTAFDPSTTRPEHEKKSAGKETANKGEANPLDKSGANHETSHPLGSKGGPEMHGTTKNKDKKASWSGSPGKEKGKAPSV